MNTSSGARALLLGAALLPMFAVASSHREAPNISGLPRVDGTDFYMFRSYEAGRGAYVTFLANYIPFQDPEGGPNFFNLDSNALYQINIDTNGDGNPDIVFVFHATNTFKDLSVNAGGKTTPIPLINIGPINAAGANLNVIQSYTVDMVKDGQRKRAQNATTGGEIFYKPTDNIGEKSIPDYATYAANFIYEIGIPGCSTPGRVFVGQRKEGFFINVGEIFDLVNLNPVGPRDGQPNALYAKNVTSFALEVPTSCIATKGAPVIGGYTTSLMRTTFQSSGDWSLDGYDVAHVQQVSRVGMPLVNEVIIGLPDKDKFNASRPKEDAQFLNYVTNPSFPVLLNVLFGKAAIAPGTPRNDLVAAYLTGVKGLNQPANVSPSEMLRLNTSTPATAPAAQNDLGVLGGDLGGFPNGRRPYDDVVDITLRVAEGALCGAIGACGSETTDPNKGTPYTDGARSPGPDAAHLHVTGAEKPTDTYLATFPYLNTPIPGSPNGPNGLPGSKGLSP